MQVYLRDLVEDRTTLVADEPIRGHVWCGNPDWSHDGTKILFDASTDMWKAHAKVLHEALEHHISEEESDVFHDLGKLYSEEERAKMGREFVTGRNKLLEAKLPSKRKAA